MNRQGIIPLILITFILFLPPILYAAGPWEGKVVGVSDGDTIKVLKDGQQVKIRNFFPAISQR